MKTLLTYFSESESNYWKIHSSMWYILSYSSTGDGSFGLKS